MRVPRYCAVAAIALSVIASCLEHAAADDVAVKGRELLAKHSASVVTVGLVLKQHVAFFGSSQEEESKTETTGTMIDPTGLTVVSLTSINPASILTDALANEPGASLLFNMTTEVISATILLEDDVELPARVVLRDPDLDLAFVRPEENPATPLPYLDLADAAELEVLDEVVTLDRLGRLGRRTPTVSTGRIEAVVAKPRTFYVPAQTLSAAFSLGCPVFALDGKVAGIVVVRKGKNVDVRSLGDIVLAIVLPASDILEAAQQAPPFEKAEESEETEGDATTASPEATDPAAP